MATLYFIIFVFIADIMIIIESRKKILRTTDLALDAALVGSATPGKGGCSRIFFNEADGQYFARSYFKCNLNLDENLENAYFKNTQFHVEFAHSGDEPLAVAEISIEVSAISAKILGFDGFPLTVNRTRVYQPVN